MCWKVEFSQPEKCKYQILHGLVHVSVTGEIPLKPNKKARKMSLPIIQRMRIVSNCSFSFFTAAGRGRPRPKCQRASCSLARARELLCICSPNSASFSARVDTSDCSDWRGGRATERATSPKTIFRLRLLPPSLRRLRRPSPRSVII